MTLALSYAMLRTQATIEQTERNSSHRATARQAAMTGMSVALRTINEPTWGGVDTGLSGSLGDGSTYAVSFETGDASLAVSDPDYSEYPYRLTINAIGSVVDPANPQIQSTHRIRSVVQLVRRKLSDAPSNWSTIKPYTVYQWGTGSGREVDIEFPVRINGPVYFQNRINYLSDYPNDGDEKPFDGSIDEVMVLGASASSMVVEAIQAGTLTLQTLVAIPAANAVAWWRFNEANGSTIAVDALGNYNGRYEGSAAGGTPGPTQGGSGSAVFDGYDDHIDVGPVNVSGSAMTILAWIKADDFDSSEGRILSKATGSNDSDHYWMLSTIDVSGRKRLRFRLKTDIGGTDVLQASTGDLTTNTWTFVAAVYDGVTMRLYKDGQLVGWRFKFGSIATSSSVRASIGNNPSGSPRARLLRDLEAMRVAGQGDFRPMAGPISAPLSLTLDHDRRLLEVDSNVPLNDVVIGGGTSPVTHPGDVTSYRLYPGGKSYAPTQLNSSISNVSLAPNPVTNPLGLVKRQSQLVLNNNVTIQGTVLVYDSGSSGRIELRGTGIKVAPVSLPSLYGDSTIYQLPSIIARDDVEVYSGSSSSLSGLVMAWDDLQCFQGKQSTALSVTGQLIAGELEIEARDEWDQSSSWWDSRHKEFLAQLGGSSPNPYFPTWLQTNHALDYQPKLTIQPDPSSVSYHWHDWSKPLFEAHPDDGGLRWDLLEWQDGN
ncbi:MAG: LamG domain-containing protein [Planctomycetaceae bacterium]|nr:LamG domain-containing protein [Planctomycetales bacterium]MCB9874423.1 LamG domain-containing protein [Planctomycetaceae bacterium]MCB9941085.1 LamG domain-containing protein [Planctomycetaceae bacterium]